MHKESNPPRESKTQAGRVDRWLRRVISASAYVRAAFLSLSLCAGNAAADYLARPETQAFIQRMVTQHGFERAELEQVFRQAERKDSILKAISRPAERSKPWYEYRDIFLTSKRIQQGVRFWQANEKTLERAASEYAVAPEIIVAILGVETRYGKNTGSYRVIDALSTLAFDYPPRSRFFGSELEQFLLLAREEGMQPLSLKGSYAGAMGYGQFIPSSFRAYAVDFDGDKRRDIWNNTSDAIGSVANYFARHGWQHDADVITRVELLNGSNPGIDELVNSSLKPEISALELKRVGVSLNATLAASQSPFALFRMQGEESPEYWLGAHNFYVITRYNRSRLYALAVFQLGQAIARERALGLASN